MHPKLIYSCASTAGVSFHPRPPKTPNAAAALSAGVWCTPQAGSVISSIYRGAARPGQPTNLKQILGLVVADRCAVAADPVLEQVEDLRDVVVRLTVLALRLRGVSLGGGGLQESGGMTKAQFGLSDE